MYSERVDADRVKAYLESRIETLRTHLEWWPKIRETLYAFEGKVINKRIGDDLQRRFGESPCASVSKYYGDYDLYISSQNFAQETPDFNRGEECAFPLS